MFNAAIFTSRGSSPIAPTGTPTLSNFRIENAEPSRVYFDSSSDITGLSATGFVISGKTISSVSVNGTNTTGHYFTVSTPFTFWDNNTIRLSGGDGTVYDFTLTYIENQIDEPATTIVRYAAPTAQGTGDGTSEANAWSYSDMVNSTKLTSTGTLVHVKAGTSSASLSLGRSGTITSPIIYKGYKTTPGDLDGVTFYNYGDGALSGVDAPLLSGSGTGQGFLSSSVRNYIIIKNFQIENYDVGIRMWGGETGRVYDNLVLNNCTSNNFQSSNTSNNRIRIKNSISMNAGDQGVNITGSYNLAYNVKSYGDLNDDAQDYYIMVEDGASYNSIINCYIERLNNISHSGHGYAIKGGSYTLVNNCIAKGINAPFQFRHQGANNCAIKNSKAYGNGQSNSAGVVFRDGASNNVIENCYIDDVATSSTYGYIAFFDSSEGTGYDETIENNIIRNCIFANKTGGNVPFIYNGIDSNTAPETDFSLLNNKIYNNTFYGDSECFLFRTKNVGITSGNEFKNNIINNVSTFEYAANASNGWTLDYNNFNGGFAAQGTNSSTTDPNFVDLVDFEPQTSLPAPKITGVDYDYNGEERGSTTTMGAQRIEVI